MATATLDDVTAALQTSNSILNTFGTLLASMDAGVKSMAAAAQSATAALGAAFDASIQGMTTSLKASLDQLKNAGKVSGGAGAGKGATDVISSWQQLGSLIGSMLPNFQGVTAAFSKVAQGMGDVTTASLATAQSVATAPIAAFQSLAKALTGDLKGAASTALAGVQGLVSGLAGIGTAIGGTLGAVIALGEQIAKFVSLANPGIVQLFTNAVNDVMAVIGQGLAPILKVITQVVRIFGDSLTTWVPTLGAIIGQVASGLLPLFKIFGDVLSKVGQAVTLVFSAAQPMLVAIEEIYTAVYGALVPVLDTIVEVVSGVMAEALKLLSRIFLEMAPYIVAFARIVKNTFQQIHDWIRKLLSSIGIELPKFDAAKGGESTGAAVKGANIGGVQEQINKAITSAFSYGAQPDDPSKKATIKTADIVSGLQKKADEIYQQLLGLPKELSDKVWESLPPSIKNALTAMEKFFGGDISGGLKSLGISETESGRGGVASTGYTTGSSLADEALNIAGGPATAASEAYGWIKRQLSPPPPPREKPRGTV